MPQPREERQGRNEALLREVNEAIERGQWPSSADDPVRFRCECALLDCNETIEMTVGEYERLRQDPRRFVLLPGHEVSDVEIVVDAHGAYIIVEKQNGAGEIADDLDPRQR